MSKRNFKDERGFLTFAVGKEYVKLAYAQALSIKLTQKNNNVAIIVDTDAVQELDKFDKIFDEVIVINHTQNGWDMSQYWQAFRLTPWRETFLVEADIIFPTSIDHWWDIVREREVCLPNAVKDFREDTITTRRYRKLFDENLLPDVYAGFVYFRYSQFAMEFFALIRMIMENWEWVSKEHIIKNEDTRIRIDEVFSLATRIMGKQYLTLPFSVPTFVHGKGGAWGLREQTPWYEQLYVEWNKTVPIIGHYHQRLPLHYHHKEWISDDIIKRYERIRNERNNNEST
jgi:hypothetical protein